MKTIEEIKRILELYKEDLEKKFKVKEIGIFGSFVRGEQKRRSDIDLLVDFDVVIGLFKFLELEEYLGELVGTKVDLISRKALKPRIGKYILQEVIQI